MTTKTMPEEEIAIAFFTEVSRIVREASENLKREYPDLCGEKP